MSPDEVVALVDAERLQIDQRLFGTYAYRQYGDSPEGKGALLSEAVADFAHRLATQPKIDWAYNGERRLFEVVPAAQPKAAPKTLSLDDLGLGDSKAPEPSLTDLGLE